MAVKTGTHCENNQFLSMKENNKAMKYLYLLLFVLWGTPQIYGQFITRKFDLMAEMGITKIKEYVFYNSDDDKVDSLLVREIFVDSLGKVSKHIDRDTSIHFNTYEFFYQDGKQTGSKGTASKANVWLTNSKYRYDQNGDLIEIKEYINGRSTKKTTYELDEAERLKKRITKKYPPSPYTLKEEFFYNEKSQLVKMRSNSKAIQIFEYEYDENGNMVELYRYEKKRGRVIDESRKFNEHNFLEEVAVNCFQSRRIPDVYHKSYAKPGDLWKVKYYYYDSGLVGEKWQWLNGQLVGVKKYYYEF